MQTVAVIGAGQMGSGIAQTAAQFGYKVLLTDVSLDVAAKAKGGIDKALGKLVGRGKTTPEEAQALLDRITPIGDYAPMTEAAFII
ncbi:MAG TPA: 3-hydroxyacyl-CoA dehydrogenase NAD-binding domain-containing protein, partial [Novosphingobium sp.]|nr:3-hydroxyacyl-CoA dehydrogenase NAD-binding domain-containing protein [Novosphingobium sp.]